MKRIPIIIVLVLLWGCGSDDSEDPNPTVEPVTFQVSITNVNSPLPFFQSGTFNTPQGVSQPGPADSGESYAFTFQAGKVYLPGEIPKLTFLTMLVASNDLFLAPSGNGIPLYDENGNPISGDITDQIYLWDAGTELNRAPGASDQPGENNDPAGSGTPENGFVTLLEESGDAIPVSISTENGEDIFIYPAVEELISVSISNVGTTFTLVIENISGSSDVSSSLSPGGYVVHTNDNPLYSEGEQARENGLEEIAEDGIITSFSAYVQPETGLVTPISPGAWAIHTDGSPLFEDGLEDAGLGLEALAEDGNPSVLASSVENSGAVSASGTFGTSSAGSGSGYTFSFEAVPGDRLSLATMFVQSNDWFFSFEDTGIPLFNAGNPISGNISGSIMLYDAGTELNQYPGAGSDQPIRQTSPDSGAPDDVPLIRKLTTTPQIVPSANSLILIQITPQN